MISVRLTEVDRRNILSLAQMYDDHAASRPSKGSWNTVRFPGDSDFLISYGFEMGFTGASMFGRDKHGTLWHVATRPRRNHNGGTLHSSTWDFILDEQTYVSVRVPSMPIDLFYRLFKK